MKKRMIAFICTLALLVGLVPVSTAVTAEAASNDRYQVGYSIRNINPWVKSSFSLDTDLGTAEFLDPTTKESKKIYPYLCSLVGNQVDWKSVITDVFDDNNDGKKDENDGIFVTCTAVTHGKDTDAEKTVLFFTVDSMKAYGELVKAVRNKIVELFGESHGIKADQIMVSTNHTHSGPQLTSSMGSYIDPIFDTDEKVAKLKKDRSAYYNWVVDQMVAAAEESLTDRAPATMSRGTVDAKDATAARGYNSGKGYQMNAIRHYEKTVTNGKNSSQQISYISSNATPSSSKLVAALNANGISNFTQGKVVTNLSDESDNTMHVLRFQFDADSGKEPVVFVNWRAHSTMNSGIQRTLLSSDYANGLRTELKRLGYRAAFFLGAAGNVVPNPQSSVYTDGSKLLKDKMDWLYEASNQSSDPTKLKIDSSKQTFIYGQLLAKVAHYCMTTANCMTGALPAGEIKNIQHSWSGNKQIYSEELKAAALECRALVEKDMQADPTLSGTTVDKEYISANITKYISDHADTYFPYRYVDPATGKTAILNTRLHYNSVYSQAISTSTATTVGGIELNAIMLGQYAAFVTSPNELADYYHDFSNYVNEDGTADMLTSSLIEQLNDWNNLKSETYGMPFVLAYSNNNSGYIANWLDYHSNSDLFYQITGKGQHGSMIYSPGTYESLTSAFAQGQGEALVAFYGKMLDSLKPQFTTKYCEACDKVVEWTPILNVTAALPNTTGHYYLYEDMPVMSNQGTNRCALSGDTTVCLDLNGHKMETQSRSFHLDNTSTVNLFDSVGTGQVISYTASNSPNGGTVNIKAGTTFNMYGGTMRFIKETDNDYYGTGTGGVVALGGTLNMYGGSIIGADMVLSSYPLGNNGSGGAVYINSTGKLNVYGGTITSGSVPEGGYGPCVFATSADSRITLSGSANVEEIYLKVKGDVLTINDAYSGSAALELGYAPSSSQDIGSCNSNIDLTGSKLTCINYPSYNVTVSGTNLYLIKPSEKTVATKYSSTGAKYSESLSAAISDSSDGYIKLNKDISETITVKKDAYLDLAGYDISGLTVSSGKTLYFMDSMTDDYSVADGNYGKVKNIKGTIAGFNAENVYAEDGYLMVTENGETSFHRVNLQLKAMSLRAEKQGVYFKSDFAGDEVVKRHVKQFGVALSIREVPNATNMDAYCKYSKFENFVVGVQNEKATSTILKGVMKEENSDFTNNRNACMPIYGRAYMLLNDGSYVFGEAKCRSFKQQVECIDTIFTSLTVEQRTAIAKLYQDFETVIKKWNVPNIISYVKK